VTRPGGRHPDHDHGQDADRDRRTVRRGLAAGAAVWAAVGGLLSTTQLAAGRGARGFAAGAALGLVFGLLAASGWLLLALLLDLLAGHRPSARRGLVTLAVVLAAMVSPVLVVALGG
jgi:hypothetical protein